MNISPRGRRRLARKSFALVGLLHRSAIAYGVANVGAVIKLSSSFVAVCVDDSCGRFTQEEASDDYGYSHESVHKAEGHCKEKN
jgi:hypothetical protein